MPGRKSVRLDGNKRPEWVIESFLRTSSDEFELHVVGSGPRKEHLMEMAAASDRAADIHFHGTIPRSEVLELMRTAALFVLPSAFENCPNVIIEAFVSGCPVVASDTMGARELITNGKTGLLFDKDNMDELTAILNRLLENEQRREELACAAYEHALQNHTIEHIADQYLTIGQQAIQTND
jgi:glycosyltransferase involved in cell wall biosynthesis